MRRFAAPGALLVGFALLASALAVSVEISSDEGFYAQAARQVSRGLVPYRDFGYTQGPVVPYVNGSAMRLFRFGVLPQRFLGAAWAVLQLVVLLSLAGRLGDPDGGLVAGAVLLLSFIWSENLVLGNTFALAGLFLSLTAWSFGAIETPGRRVVAVLLFGALATGCRLSMLPFPLLLAAAVVREVRRPAFAAWTALVAAGSLLLVYGPFFLADAPNTLFWTVTFHLSTSLGRRGILTVWEAVLVCPAMLALIPLGLAGALRTRTDSSGRARALRWLLAASSLTIALNLAVKAPYGGYVAPMVGVLAVSAVLLARHSSARARAVALTCLAAALAGAVLVQAAFVPSSLEDLGQAAAFLRAHTGPDALVATTVPEVAVEAAREVLPGLDMGKFGLTEEMSEERAGRLKMATPASLERAFRGGGIAAIVLSQSRNWNFAWSAPSLTPTSPAARARLRRALDESWRVAYANERYLVLLPR